jgi:low affinity Fe/Cu permease
VPEAPRLRERIYVAFGELANRTSLVVGSPWAFLLAGAAIVAWGMSGPWFGFSDTWQLVINTGTTVVTFLIVFLIQHTQNKDARAIQLKLNEILAALDGASNRLINVEDLSDAELDRLHGAFERLALRVRREGQARRAHSIEEESAGPPGRPT